MFKKIRFTLVALISIALFTCQMTAFANTPAVANWSSYNIPSAPELNAKAYILVDAATGQVLAAKNPDMKLEPASLTKLMTLYLVFSELANGQLKLTVQVLISKKAWKTGGSRMFVKVGSKVSVEDLIQGITVQSGNDATVALAEHLGGTTDAFVQMMNQSAESLGMDNTHFADPTGLPSPENLSSAHDLSILASAIIDQYPQYYHYFSEKWFVWNNIRQPNRNKLLWREFNVDGLKTGYTAGAGYCLVSSAAQNGTRFVTVVLGAPNAETRANDSQALLNYAFRFFQTQKIYSAGQNIVEQRVWKGQDKYVALGVAKNFGVTLPRTALADIKITMEYSNDIVAPVTQNQVVGTINVYLKNQLIATQSIVALRDDPKGGFFTRFFSGIAHFFYGLFHKDTVMQDVATK